MGDRVSISLVADKGLYPEGMDVESVTVCSHWGGKEFVNRVLTYLKKYKSSPPDPNGLAGIGANISTPQTRMDPWTVIADVVAEFHGEVSIAKNMDNCDNSDNGHFRISVPSLKLEGPFWRKGESPKEVERRFKIMSRKKYPGSSRCGFCRATAPRRAKNLLAKGWKEVSYPMAGEDGGSGPVDFCPKCFKTLSPELRKRGRSRVTTPSLRA